MDVTPQVLHEVEFRAKVRGYDPDEVDDFLERVAVGVGQLQDRLREAVERAASAESQAAELRAKVKAGGSSTNETDETLRRTLVLAQRTADAAIKEANAEAERTREDAKEQAEKLVGEAEQRAAAILKDAEAEVRKGVDATRQRLVSEIIDLEATRDSVRADVAALERHLDEQRLRLRGSVADLQRLIDDPASLKGMPTPLLTEATLPAKFAAEPEVLEPEPEVEPEPPAATEEDSEDDLPVDDLVAAVDLDLDLTDDAVAEGADEPVSVHDIFAPVADDRPAGVGEGRIGLFDDLDTDVERRGFEFDAPGTPTEPVVRIPEGPEGDDAYLAELRKAMLTTDADEDEDEPPPASSGDAVPAPKFRSRFGRRR